MSLQSRFAPQFNLRIRDRGLAYFRAGAVKFLEHSDFNVLAGELSDPGDREILSLLMGGKDSYWSNYSYGGLDLPNPFVLSNTLHFFRKFFFLC